MVNTDFDEQVVALAGCCQAAGMVYKLSQQGQVEDELISIALKAVLQLTPHSPIDIYGGVANIQPGLRLLKEQLYPQTKRNFDIGRYLANLISLQSQLSHADEMTLNIRNRLGQINRQKSLLSLDETSQINAVASLYQDSISSLPLRIQVTGHAKYLKIESVQRLIRTALFFGLRSAMLWRQLGGKKRHFLLKRRAIAEKTVELLL